MTCFFVSWFSSIKFFQIISVYVTQCIRSEYSANADQINGQPLTNVWCLLLLTNFARSDGLLTFFLNKVRGGVILFSYKWLNIHSELFVRVRQNNCVALKIHSFVMLCKSPREEKHLMTKTTCLAPDYHEPNQIYAGKRVEWGNRGGNER